jgi:general secretion pathway protein H
MSATGEAREDGFTLLEALVVVALAAAISALMFPTLQRTLQVLALRQSASVFAAELRAGRARALRSGQPVAVSATPDGGAYGWTGAALTRLPEGVTLTIGGPRAIAFYPDGSSSGGEAVLARGPRRSPISVDPVTGGVAARP